MPLPLVEGFFRRHPQQSRTVYLRKASRSRDGDQSQARRRKKSTNRGRVDFISALLTILSADVSSSPKQKIGGRGLLRATLSQIRTTEFRSLRSDIFGDPKNNHLRKRKAPKCRRKQPKSKRIIDDGLPPHLPIHPSVPSDQRTTRKNGSSTLHT